MIKWEIFYSYRYLYLCPGADDQVRHFLFVWQMILWEQVLVVAACKKIILYGENRYKTAIWGVSLWVRGKLP